MMVSIHEGETTMAMTAAERVRAVRERRRRREIQLTVVLHEDDMTEIAVLRSTQFRGAPVQKRCWARMVFDGSGAIGSAIGRSWVGTPLDFVVNTAASDLVNKGASLRALGRFKTRSQRTWPRYHRRAADLGSCRRRWHPTPDRAESPTNQQNNRS
jgi:hypothetical protein